MYLEGKDVLVSGATGQVGSAVIRRILATSKKTKIRAVYHRSKKPFFNDKRVKYVTADLTVPGECVKVSKGCDCAVLAAAVTLNSATAGNDKFGPARDNMLMSLNMLEALKVNDIERVVYIGSATVYQESGKPLKESGLDLNDDPATPYFGIGWSGRFVEKMCADWHRDTGNDMIMVRSANVYGPYAKFDPRTSNFIPALIRKAVARMEPFRVWGDPGVKRDVIFADDFAGAIVALLNSTRIKMDCFNVGSGSAISVRSAVNAVLKGAGYMPKRIVYGQKAPVTVKGRVLDISRITKLTGWRPGVSLDKGVAITVEWWRDNKGWWKK